MWLALIFVGVVGLAWLVLARLLSAQPAATENEAAGEAPRHAELWSDQVAHLVEEQRGPVVRMPGGGFKPQSEIDEEDESIVAFKAELRRWPVPELDGEHMALSYAGDGEAVRVIQLRAVLIGRRGVYLDCWWHDRSVERLFRVDRIERIIDPAGEFHTDALAWIVRSGVAGAALAEELGFELPPD